MVDRYGRHPQILPILLIIVFTWISGRCNAIDLPIEVVGAPGTSQSVVLTLPESAPAVAGIDVQINNIEYPNEVDLQVNNGAWISLNNSTATAFGAGSDYGGIGSPVVNLTLHVPLPAGLVKTGNNTVSFRFDHSDGNCSGFRVLELWFTDTNSFPVADEMARYQEDPSTWTPPLNDAADIAEGLKLWQSAALKSSFGPNNHNLQAHCDDCHASDGVDLKFFNFSNQDIIARSEFHGLTQLQGEQIASYIRSLPASDGSVNGRPWNPPFQPGPGLSSSTPFQWSAGAGNSAVLDNDAEEASYLFPNGITQAAVQTLATPGPNELNPRNIPISLPLLTWDQWLPKEAPQDIFGVSTFQNSKLYQMWLNRSSALWIPSNNTGGGGIDYWTANEQPLLQTINASGPQTSFNQTNSEQAYALSQWIVVHTWQIEQEHFQAYPSSKLNWYNNIPFGLSPHSLNIPSGMLTGSALGDLYLGSAWYQIQVSVDSGDDHPGGNAPIDWGYYPGVIDHLYSEGGPAQPYRLTEGFLIAMRNFDGPISAQNWGGWLPKQADSLVNVLGWPPLALWNGNLTSFSQVMDALIPVWLQRANSYTALDYYTFEGVSPTDMPTSYMGQNWYSGIWGAIPILRQAGVDQSLLTQLASFGKAVFPNADWANQ